MENNESTQSKYDAALAKYNTNLNDAEVAAEVAGIIAEESPCKQYSGSKEVPVQLASNLTTLNSTDSDESVMKFTQKVNQFDEEFPDLKNVAAICVYPQLCGSSKGYAGSGRRKDSLRIGRFPLFTDFHRSKSSRNRHGNHGRRG